MIEIIWRYVVKEEARGRFELAYGPGGAWSDLFARCPGYRGTTLLRDTSDPCRYVTIDVWESEDDRRQMLADRREEYAELDATFAEWTETEEEIGVFRVHGAGSVRPMSGRRRRPRRGSG